MNTFLILACIIAAASARPDGLLEGHDGHVSVTQSSLGTYRYTVHLRDSFRTEERLADGTIFGEYSIPSADGLPQTIKYVAGRDGFRIVDGLPLVPLAEVPDDVAAVPVVGDGDNVEILSSRSGLDVPIVSGTSTSAFAPVVPLLEHAAVVPSSPVVAYDGLPLPVEDTPEVKAAREEFFALHRAAAARAIV